MRIEDWRNALFTAIAVGGFCAELCSNGAFQATEFDPSATFAAYIHLRSRYDRKIRSTPISIKISETHMTPVSEMLSRQEFI